MKHTFLKSERYICMESNAMNMILFEKERKNLRIDIMNEENLYVQAGPGV